jgi:hypothetical protein
MIQLSHVKLGKSSIIPRNYGMLLASSPGAPSGNLALNLLIGKVSLCIAPKSFLVLHGFESRANAGRQIVIERHKRAIQKVLVENGLLALEERHCFLTFLKPVYQKPLRESKGFSERACPGFVLLQGDAAILAQAIGEDSPGFTDCNLVIPQREVLEL